MAASSATSMPSSDAPARRSATVLHPRRSDPPRRAARTPPPHIGLALDAQLCFARQPDRRADGSTAWTNGYLHPASHGLAERLPTNAALDAPKLDSIRFRLAYVALEPVLWESPKIGKLLINFNEIDGKWRRAAALYREALHSRRLSGGPETRPATMFYSVKRTPTSILEPLRRVDTSKCSSPCFGDEHSLTRSAPCRPVGPEPPMSTAPNPAA